MKEAARFESWLTEGDINDCVHAQELLPLELYFPENPIEEQDVPVTVIIVRGHAQAAYRERKHGVSG